jgi:chromate transporter
MASNSGNVAADRPDPGIGALFWHFLILGITGFGGVMPMARRMIVERVRWLDADEFAELLGLSQILPGGNVINLAVFIGQRFRGTAGAVAAIAGLLLAPSVLVVVLGSIYDRYHAIPQVRHVFAGLAAAAAGLLASTALKIVAQLDRSARAILVAVACFAAIAVLRLPLLPTLVVLAPLSILVQRVGRR